MPVNSKLASAMSYFVRRSKTTGEFEQIVRLFEDSLPTPACAADSRRRRSSPHSQTQQGGRRKGASGGAAAAGGGGAAAGGGGAGGRCSFGCGSLCPLFDTALALEDMYGVFVVSLLLQILALSVWALEHITKRSLADLCGFKMPSGDEDPAESDAAPPATGVSHATSTRSLNGSPAVPPRRSLPGSPHATSQNALVFTHPGRVEDAKSSVQVYQGYSGSYKAPAGAFDMQAPGDAGFYFEGRDPGASPPAFQAVVGSRFGGGMCTPHRVASQEQGHDKEARRTRMCGGQGESLAVLGNGCFWEVLGAAGLQHEAEELAANGIREVGDLAFLDDDTLHQLALSPVAKAKLKAMCRKLSLHPPG